MYHFVQYLYHFIFVLLDSRLDWMEENRHQNTTDSSISIFDMSLTWINTALPKLLPHVMGRRPKKFVFLQGSLITGLTGQKTIPEVPMFKYKLLRYATSKDQQSTGQGLSLSVQNKVKDVQFLRDTLIAGMILAKSAAEIDTSFA